MVNNAVDIINLTKKYKDMVAVDNINVEIKRGELYALLGVNGAGKTTTIKMLSCISKPTSGTAIIEGKDIVENAEYVKKIINVSPQESAVAGNLTVEENIIFTAEMYGYSKNMAKEKSEMLMNELGLFDVRSKKAKNLSGGYKRRLSIALAMVNDPKIIFLDEPTLGLDVLARRELWKIIEGLKLRSTIILTTHYMEEAEKLADKIAVMKQGKIIATGSVKELLLMTETDNLEDAFIKIVEEI